MGAVVKFEDQSIEEAFPDVDPELEVFGARVLVQIRQPRTKSRGGIHLTNDTIDAEKWTTQVGLVRFVGPGAFRDRKTNEVWPELAWCKVGDFVRTPLYGGDRVSRPILGTSDTALFIVFRDLDLIGKVMGDPLDS